MCACKGNAIVNARNRWQEQSNLDTPANKRVQLHRDVLLCILKGLHVCLGHIASKGRQVLSGPTSIGSTAHTHQRGRNCRAQCFGLMGCCSHMKVACVQERLMGSFWIYIWVICRCAAPFASSAVQGPCLIASVSAVASSVSSVASASILVFNPLNWALCTFFISASSSTAICDRKNVCMESMSFLNASAMAGKNPATCGLS